jgi:hypothetical protein
VTPIAAVVLVLTVSGFTLALAFDVFLVSARRTFVVVIEWKVVVAPPIGPLLGTAAAIAIMTLGTPPIGTFVHVRLLMLLSGRTA